MYCRVPKAYLRANGPKLFVVKNGWGHTVPGPTAEIPDLAAELARARADKYVIVTCDADLYDQLPPYMRTQLEAHVVRVGLEDYDDDARWQIVLNAARLTGWQLQSLARSRLSVLRELHAPKTLSHFGTLVHANVLSLREVDNHRADDAWYELEEFLPVADPNSNLFDALIEQANVETVGFDKCRTILGFEPYPKQHAALLYAMNLSFLGHCLIMDGNRAISGVLLSAIGDIKRSTGDYLDLDRFVGYLHKKTLVEKDEDGSISIPRTTVMVLRDIVRDAPGTVNMVVMSVAPELARLFPPSLQARNVVKFADLAECIIGLTKECYRDDPIPSNSWSLITERVQRYMEYALIHPDICEFGRIVEIAMRWEWELSPLCAIVHALNPSQLPDKPKPADAYLFVGTRSLSWSDTFKVVHSTILRTFVRRFLIEFMPKTRLDYSSVSEKFALFLHTPGVVDHEDVRCALRTMETHHMTDYDDGDDSFRLYNKPALLMLLALVSRAPYQTIIPPPLNEWEL